MPFTQSTYELVVYPYWHLVNLFGVYQADNMIEKGFAVKCSVADQEDLYVLK